MELPRGMQDCLEIEFKKNWMERETVVKASGGLSLNVYELFCSKGHEEIFNYNQVYEAEALAPAEVHQQVLEDQSEQLSSDVYAAADAVSSGSAQPEAAVPAKPQPPIGSGEAPKRGVASVAGAEVQTPIKKPRKLVGAGGIKAIR